MFEVNTDNLKLVRELGRGTFGEVFEMIHEPTQTIFAVKKISEQNQNRNVDSDIETEISDITAHKELGNHPYLIDYFGALHADAYYWVLSELMDCSLDDFIRRIHQKNVVMPEAFFSNVARVVLTAISFMKTKQFIHRDIKPSNILINSDFTIKVCDFGISGKLVNSINLSTGKGCRLYMPVIFYLNILLENETLNIKIKNHY